MADPKTGRIVLIISSYGCSTSAVKQEESEDRNKMMNINGMKKIIKFAFQPRILMGIPVGAIMGLVLTHGLSSDSQQMLAKYSLDRSRVIIISSAAFYGAGLLGCLIAEPFRISEEEYLLQLTKDEMHGLEISAEDKDALAQGIWEVSKDLNRHDSNFSQEKVIELVQKFQEPSADKRVAMQEFQDVMRSS